MSHYSQNLHGSFFLNNYTLTLTPHMLFTCWISTAKCQFSTQLWPHFMLLATYQAFEGCNGSIFGPLHHGGVRLCSGTVPLLLRTRTLWGWRASGLSGSGYSFLLNMPVPCNHVLWWNGLRNLVDLQMQIRVCGKSSQSLEVMSETFRFCIWTLSFVVHISSQCSVPGPFRWTFIFRTH